MPVLKLVAKQSQSQKKSKSNEVMLMYRYTNRAKTMYSFTGKNIDKNYFDSKNQCIKKSYAGYSKFNMLLSKQRQKIDDVINSALAEDIDPSVEYVKNVLAGKKETQNKKQNFTFWQYVEIYMKDSAIRLKPNSVRGYNNTLNNLKAFEEFRGTELNWDSFNVGFYYEYLDFYTNYKGLTNNGFGKTIKILKCVLNSASERGINTNLGYKNKEFKALREEVNNVYLTEGELKSMMDLDLTSDKKCATVRDLFIIGCYTGLRFSDLSKLTNDNICNNIIRVKTIKTGTLVVLPLLTEVKQILGKYNGILPRSYSQQKTNDYLKVIAQKAGIDQIIEKIRTSGTKRIKVNVPKHDMITTHTARRSFATNMYKRGIDPLAIMQLTGHTTEKSFMTYIKVSQEENAMRILEQFKDR